jgi:hypothetical protein
MLVSLSKKLPTLTPSQFTTLRVRLREQLPALALIRRLPFGVRANGIRRKSYAIIRGIGNSTLV